MFGMRAASLLSVGLWATLAFSSGVVAQPEEPTLSAEPLITRSLTGTLVCKNMADGSACGVDSFTLTVQSDGTRVLRTFFDWSITASQMNTVIRVDDNFRPLDGFAMAYLGGAFNGSGFYVVTDETLDMFVNSPEERFAEKTPRPENFSLLLHPISADGWHFGYYDMDKGGKQNGHTCTLGEIRRSVHCEMQEKTYEHLGSETLTVPAGTFETEHFLFGNTHVWFTGPDRIVVQHEHDDERGGTRFQLTALSDSTQ